MSDEIILVVRGMPKGQPRARARAGLRGVYTPSTAKDWKSCVYNAACALPGPPIDVPVRIDVEVYFKRPKTFSKPVRDFYGGTKSIPSGRVVHQAKPDRDNADKAILDALTNAGMIVDDKIVSLGQIAKYYHAEGGRPGAVIRIRKIRPEDVDPFPEITP